MTEGLTRIKAGNYTRLAKETKLYIACRRGFFQIRLVNDNFDSVTKLFPKGRNEADVLDAIKHPALPGVFYIGVRGQGVWHSENDGDVWSLSADSATFGDSGSPMIKLATDRSGARIVAKFGRNVVKNDAAGDPSAWVATTSVGFSDRDDGGSDIGYRGNYSGTRGEWTHAVAVHPTNPDVIAVGQTALFISENGGSSWTQVGAGHEDMQSLAFSPDGDRLYVANDGGVFFRTLGTADDIVDEATVSLNTRLTTMQFYRVGVQGNIAVGDADHQGIRGTANLNAETPLWEYATRKSSGYGNNALENNFVTADPNRRGRFFVDFNDDLLRLKYPRTPSTEDLLAFNNPAVPLRPFTRISSSPAETNQLNYAVGTVAVDPRANSTTILASVHEQVNTAFGVYMTNDGDVDPTGGPRVVCDTDTNAGTEGVVPSLDGANTVWGSFECSSTTQNSEFFTTEVNGTSTWRPTSLVGLSAPVVSIIFTRHQPGKAYALDESGTVWAKDEVNDDGEDWRRLGSWPLDDDDTARQIIVDAESPQGLYAVSHKRFVRSFDGGQTWSRAGQSTLPPDQQINSVGAHPGNEKLSFIGTNRDLLMSTNRGVSWSSIGRRLPNAPVMHVFAEGGHLYAVTFGRGLWRMKLSECPCKNR